MSHKSYLWLVSTDILCDSVLKCEFRQLETCRAGLQCAEFIERVPLSDAPLHSPSLRWFEGLPGWSPSLSTLVSCCLAANNRRCLQSNLPLPRPMRTRALFHQTTLFRICKEATFSKCYCYRIRSRLRNLLATLLWFKTLFNKLSGRMKTEGFIRIRAHNVGMELQDFDSRKD